MAVTSPHPATPMNGSAAWLVIGCLWLVSIAAWAAAAGSANLPPEAGSEPEPEHPAIDDARNTARASAVWLARQVDGWFGNHPFDDGGSVTDGRLSLSVFKRADQSPDVDLRFDARFRLPNFERSAYLFIGRDNPREAIRDTPQVRATALQAARVEDPSLLAGLGFSVLRDIDMRVGVSSRFKPYVQARYTKPWAPTPNQLLVLRQTLFLTQEDQLGSTTALNHEWALRPELRLRWVNAATITQVSKNFEWSSTLGAYREFAPQCVLGLELLANGTGTQGTGLGRSDQGVLGRWEQPVYKDWLLGELVAGHFWPRADSGAERGRAWALGGSLKMRF